MTKNDSNCNTCGAAFETEDELKEHEREMHSQFKCEVCGKMFDS